MATKICVLFAALMLAGIAIPIAHAQTVTSPTIGLNITGVVPCGVNGSAPISTTNVFPNAAVQLSCAGTTMATTTTDRNGAFSISVTNMSTSLLSSFPCSCKIMVTTPLASCNARLPSTGSLAASLQMISIMDIISLTITGFASNVLISLTAGNFLLA